MKAVIALTAFISVALLAGCNREPPRQGVNITAPGVNVQVDKGGVDVNAPGVKVIIPK